MLPWLGRGRRETLCLAFAGLDKLDDFPGRHEGEARVAEQQHAACPGERIDHALHGLGFELRMLLDCAHDESGPAADHQSVSATWPCGGWSESGAWILSTCGRSSSPTVIPRRGLRRTKSQ